MAQLVDIYRQEIIESEKVRADFMKWKMIMVGAIGSAGLGLIGTISHTDTEIILCIIPLTCLYLDVLCYQQSLRVFVIAKFIIDTDGIEPMNKSYEWLCRRTHKGHFFVLEDIALSWSTIVSSILLITLMIIIKLFRAESTITWTTVAIVVVASLIGVCGSLYVSDVYKTLRSKLI